MNNWIINLMYTVLITTITGSIFSIVWYLIGYLLEKIGFLNIQFQLFKVIVFFWMVPFAYFLLKLQNQPDGWFGGELFAFSPAIFKFSVVFCSIWIVGVIINLLIYLCQLIYLRRRYYSSVACGDDTYQIFLKICQEMQVSTNHIDIAWDYKQKVPVIIGVFHTKIILPVKEYTQDELATVFYHEITHYKQKDVVIKNIYAIVQSINWFNPIVWWIGKKMPQFCEYTCDYIAIQYTSGIQSYYETILSMTEEQSFVLKLSTHLTENKESLVKRVNKINRIYKKKNRSKILAGIFVFVLFLSSLGLTYGSTVSTGEIYRLCYNDTVVEEEEKSAPIQKNKVLTGDFFSEPSNTKKLLLDEESGIGWVNDTIEADECYLSDLIYFEKGRVVWAVNYEEHAQIQAGIVFSDGKGTYAIFQQDGIIEFPIDRVGEYRVFVKNTGENDVEVQSTVLLSFYE